jgi:16S rRNA (adenine1518-N6/adenine1519-N6)-dimethyltransferase
VSHQPRKRFGQHFLHDPSIIGKIVAAIDPQPGDLLVEIGPGQGAITRPLLDRAGSLHVVELDRDLAYRLQETYAGDDRLVVHTADALRFDFASLCPPDRRIRIVGNLPYNVSTPLMFHLLEQRQCIRDMHFMLQKEVVKRMAAPPGSRQYGRLTVMLAAYCRVEHLFDVGPGAFRPPPRVYSSVVRLVPWPELPFPMPAPRVFADVVRRAFSMRRKTLKNALKGMVGEDAIRDAGCDPGCRPETLSAEQFGALAAQLCAAGLADTDDDCPIL